MFSAHKTNSDSALSGKTIPTETHTHVGDTPSQLTVKTDAPTPHHSSGIASPTYSTPRASLELLGRLTLERKKSNESTRPPLDPKERRESSSTTTPSTPPVVSKRLMGSPTGGDSSKRLLAMLAASKVTEGKESKDMRKPSTAPFTTLGPPLPLIEQAKKQVPLPADGGPNFEEVGFLSSEHSLVTTLPVFGLKFERGLRPQRTVMATKSYSNHAPSTSKLREAGVNVVECPEWTTIDGFEDSYDAACTQAFRDYVDILEVEKADLIPIIMDDGGRLAKMLRQASNASARRHLKTAVIIEQTSSGADSAERCVTTPRVNLFAAFVKTEGEAPLVAASTVQNIIKEVEKVRTARPEFKFEEFKKSSIAVIGAGNMGMAMIKELARQGIPEIRVYDTDSKKIENAVALGAPFTRSASDDDKLVEAKTLEEENAPTEITGVDSATEAFQNCDIVIGATGNPIISEGYQKKNLVSRPVIAASVSSRQVDFLPWVRYARSLNSDEASRKGESYEPVIDHTQPIYIKNGYRGKGRLGILRHGTPVTFDQGPHAMPPEHAQLTRTLIVGSQFQALEIANEKAASEKHGRKFTNTDYKLSPLWQLYTAKMFLDTLSPTEARRYYSEDILAKMVDIKAITAGSKGNLYLPFELKLRGWLNNWLKENGLDKAVDEWLSPTPSSSSATAKSTMRMA